MFARRESRLLEKRRFQGEKCERLKRLTLQTFVIWKWLQLHFSLPLDLTIWNLPLQEKTTLFFCAIFGTRTTYFLTVIYKVWSDKFIRRPSLKILISRNEHSPNYRLFLQMGTKKNSADSFYLFSYARNDSASYVENFAIPFFANRQFFLKFSKICKKINFEAFFMHISL